MGSIRRVPVLIVALLLLPAAAAQADTYCVNTTGCDATHDMGADLQAALTAAEAHLGTDDVLVGDGNYASAGFAYDSPDAVHIQGAGGRSVGRAGPTLVDSDADPSGHTQVEVLGSEQSTIAGIDVAVPGGTGSGNTGIDTTGRVQNVLVESDGAASAGATGVRLRGGGSLADSDVLLRRDAPGGVGVAIAGPGVSVADSRIEASDGVATTAADASALAQRLRVEFDTTGALVRGGELTVEDSLFVNRTDTLVPRRGLSVNTLLGDAALRANHVTLVGAADADARGLLVQASAARRGELVFRNGIVTNYPGSLVRVAAGGGTADLTTEYSDYSGGVAQSSGPGTLVETNRTTADPAFTGGADYHLRPDSPLVDAGDPAGLSAEESPADLAGAPRVLDGGGDCVMRRDIGAFEFQPGPRAPVAVATAATDLPATNQAIRFDASESCDPDGDPLTFAWAFDDGSVGEGVTRERGFSRAGLHFAAVTVTDSTGRSSTAVAAVRVVRPELPPFAGITIPKQTVKVSRSGVAAVKLRCPLDTVGLCAGKITLSRVGDKRLGSTSLSIARGATRKVNVQLTRRARTALTKARRLNVTAAVSAHDTNGTSHRTRGTIKLVAPRS